MESLCMNSMDFSLYRKEGMFKFSRAQKGNDKLKLERFINLKNF